MPQTQNRRMDSPEGETPPIRQALYQLHPF